MLFAFCFYNYNLYRASEWYIKTEMCLHRSTDTQILSNYNICHTNFNVEFIYCAEYEVCLVTIDRH